MHRARSAFSLALAPVGQQSFASWLLKGANKSRLSKEVLGASSIKCYNSTAAEPFLDGTSSSYVEEMYNSWLRDPASVHRSWDAYFRNNAYCPPPSLAPTQKGHVPISQFGPYLGGGSALSRAEPDEKTIDDHLAVQAIIRSYQIRGHHIANLDPLGINSSEITKESIKFIYNNYNFDYRHSAGGGGVLSPYHPYNQQSAMRYPQTAIFHNGSVRPPNIYDNYYRFGYQPSSYNPNYNGSIFGYNQTNVRDNSFYGHHHPYDSFRIAPAYPYHHHHHQNSREHYNPDVYGSSRSGYVMRDTLPSSYPYSAARNVGEYPYHHHHHNGGVPREFYQTSHHNLPNNVDTAGAHHATESIYGEYPAVPASQFVANGSNGFTSNSNATAFSTVSPKDSKPRKHQRDKNLSKLAAMSRRLETSSNMINEIDRIGGIGTTPFIPNLYQNHLPEHNPNNFNPTNSSRFHDESSPSNTIPNWHSTEQTNPTYSWMNGPYGSRPHHRKRHLTPEPQVSPMLPSIRPPSQPSTTKDYQKIASGVLESDFIPSKKRRKNKTDNEDSLSSREELQNITPLPGFQQAFGSTEIGRFSEVFFNAPESPFELAFESEADTLSPQAWETGDSLEGPHINLQIGATVQPIYAESYASTDSPASSSYFSEIRCNDF